MKAMKKFKIRCSKIGDIMTNARSKNEILGQTCKSYLELWMKEQLFNRRSYFTSKYTVKGNQAEVDSIEFLSDQLGEFLVKNEKFYKNDHLTGTPDMIVGDMVIDVKNSWSWQTFPLYETIPDKKYVAQLQGYMALTGAKRAKLVYTLSDTPKHLIEAEAYRFVRNEGLPEMTEEIYKSFEKDLTYSDVPDKLKIKQFDIEWDQDYIDSVYERVEECREYIQGL